MRQGAKPAIERPHQLNSSPCSEHEVSRNDQSPIAARHAARHRCGESRVLCRHGPGDPTDPSCCAVQQGMARTMRLQRRGQQEASTESSPVPPTMYSRRQAMKFPVPHDVKAATIPGTEGWERMYPYQYQFVSDDPERNRYEKETFWFYDGLHYPEPLYPFDTICDRSEE